MGRIQPAKGSDLARGIVPELVGTGPHCPTPSLHQPGWVPHLPGICTGNGEHSGWQYTAAAAAHLTHPSRPSWPRPITPGHTLLRWASSHPDLLCWATLTTPGPTLLGLSSPRSGHGVLSAMCPKAWGAAILDGVARTLPVASSSRLWHECHIPLSGPTMWQRQ